MNLINNNCTILKIGRHPENSLLVRKSVKITIGDITDSKARLLDEIDTYLTQPSNEHIPNGLKDFPSIHKIFLKYNCIRPSEAICERLFSYAGKTKIKSCIFLISLCRWTGLVSSYWFWDVFSSLLYSEFVSGLKTTTDTGAPWSLVLDHWVHFILDIGLGHNVKRYNATPACFI